MCTSFGNGSCPSLNDPSPNPLHRYIKISYFAGVYVDVPIKMCLGSDPKVQMSLQATQAVRVDAEAGVILFIVRGGVRVEAQLMAIQMGPRLTLRFQGGHIDACNDFPIVVGVHLFAMNADHATATLS